MYHCSVVILCALVYHSSSIYSPFLSRLYSFVYSLGSDDDIHVHLVDYILRIPPGIRAIGPTGRQAGGKLGGKRRPTGRK